MNAEIPDRAYHSSLVAARLPFISVVIPVRNEEAHLGALLEDLRAQDYPTDRFEILIVDGESTDGTRGVAQRHAGSSGPGIRVLPNLARLSSAGRNVGVRNSQGEVIIFVDGHCRIPSHTLLRDAARILQQTGADCLCRPQPLATPGNNWFQDVVAHVRATLIGHGRGSEIYSTDREGFVDPTSSGAIYRRSVFDRVGMYDEGFDACEDLEFNYRVHRAGLCAYSSPLLAVSYRPRSSLRGLFRQTVRYGRGRFRFMQKHPEGATLSQLIPAVFVAVLAAGLAGTGLWSVARQALLVILGGYTALLLAFSMRLGLRHGWRHLLAAPAVYLAIHGGFGMGYWLEAGQAFSNWMGRGPAGVLAPRR